ncbi:maleylpyruvate isomerase family mycothiol-dependent enzyme [Mycobacterium crocinum]|uniref:Maleylpyruvate isomerase family mycothiol-dependent enzyme n=1 Tax=Mycolicibacterium crocinum TaxID=388459 RepID=A0ABY3TKW4_9MYCO|nr:maleylpyruvate isomerase family mycothiol-dependent enzyme [Mycolicibacterium crocinum]MCV7215027.1 maleylpyruvate isomerase family mycothiol-dependent enzyme [Mycolicibacterium crocinum]ULN42090.1 maleylpyruvate isomerase family mycothiol-dependent enzyme [Mycolicibacterium crocinum]
MDFATALLAENAAFADLLRDADLSIPVPTCPEWTLEQLMRHVGRGDRWCAQIVAEQSMDFIDPRTVEGGKPPAGRDNEIAWLQAGPRQLIDAVAATGADTAVWTFLGPRPASWWIRRRLHEVVVHRADAAIALGIDYDVDPALAADAITEWLERVEIQADEEGPAGGDRPVADEHSIHLHATDSGLGEAGEWTILGRPDGIAVEQGHGKATVALRGPARDLLLAVVRRRSAAEEGVEIFGDSGVWDTWLARTPF